MNNIKYKIFDLPYQKACIEREIEILQDKIAGINKLMKEICHHPKDYIQEKSYYFPGSYNDMAYTDYWSECTLCGCKSERSTESHSWYG